jgi:hypothetical protein
VHDLSADLLLLPLRFWALTLHYSLPVVKLPLLSVLVWLLVFS